MGSDAADLFMYFKSMQIDNEPLKVLFLLPIFLCMSKLERSLKLTGDELTVLTLVVQRPGAAAIKCLPKGTGPITNSLLYFFNLYTTKT